MSQLALPLRLQDHAVFETFWPAGNESVVAWLEELGAEPKGPGAWIWGRSSAGKSHLLQALCDRLGDQAAYVPLRELRDAGPGILEGLEARGFLCIDDAAAVAGDGGWERALFNLFNAAAESTSVLVIASQGPPADSGFELADLVSRFSQLAVFRLRPLDDDELERALQLRARHRGLELPDETARYLSRRSRRDMASLYALLDRLDSESLIAKRRLTVPFVKSVLDRMSGR